MNAIDLWHGTLSPGDTIDQRHWRLLDASERQRALRLKYHSAQARHVELHALTRRILARYLARRASRIGIGREARGKPYLIEDPEWTFNLSHSENRFALAIAKNCRLGVDIELCKSRSTLAALVKKCFAEKEALYWQNLPEGEKLEQFYRFWTRKEAFVKATGGGIALGLKQCVINPDNPQALLHVPENCGLTADWRIADIDLSEGVACAVANDGGIDTVKLLEIDDELAATF
ncbi:MAG: 4-phosphopantetheinyl transferase [Gammaproteobacteria bacterium HGW-Gammaproteobacteria-3]|nr:MAG: 4-phosphopantetheinyl transferase [Gammaproteobacteria bacterium HGW-Gammaproteobacteria-3]